jgi:hypothetical protein
LQDINSSAVAERDPRRNIYINAPTIGPEYDCLSAAQAWGRERGGRAGRSRDMFTKWKVIYRDFSSRLRRLR